MGTFTQVSLEDLPRECLLAIFQNLAIRDIEALGCTNKLFAQLANDDQLWRSLALQKWGHRVEDLAGPRIASGHWRQFARHRMSRASYPISPLNLLQESFPDPWAHIACCLLCSRTTGGPAVRAAVARVLSTWPTPSAVLDASDENLFEAINPLGLQAVRLAALRSMSHDFLAKEWELPSEFKGCGKFVTDSYLIFCRGLRQASQVDDVNLQRYLRWVEKGDGGEKKKKASSGEGTRAKRQRVDKEARKNGNEARAARAAARQAAQGLRRTTRSLAK